MTALLEVADVGKSFDGNSVLSSVSFQVERGEAVALVGENGAGKSTLSKIIAGALRPDRGTVLINGRSVDLRSPRDALGRGVAFIPQELATVPDLTVAENVMLGRWPGRAGLTGPKQIRTVARANAQRFGLDVPLERKIGSLRLAERQLAEILKALVRNASVLLLDEPTSALTEQESAALFAVLTRMRADGVGIIYISHRLDETYGFADRIIVLRNGSVALTTTPERTDRDVLISAMLGHERPELSRPVARRSTAHSDQPVLKLSDWTAEGTERLRGVSLAVGRGEVVGLFGLRGSGADLLGEILGGKRTAHVTGSLEVDGRRAPIPRTPRRAWLTGLAYLPADRKVDGLVLNQSAAVNLTLPVLRTLGRFGTINRRRETVLAEGLRARFDVRARSLRQPTAQLSGGNQQKVLLASRVVSAPKVLVLHEPTRGVDIGARTKIHEHLRHSAQDGLALLVVTSDLEEAVLISDRLLVMRDGAIVAELLRTDGSLTQARALQAATWRPDDDAH